jgi:uncharacterized damage-inducible protein DinB
VADRSYVAENRIARERLQTFVEKLTDTDMGRPLGDGWTVSAALGHLAFWDQRWAEKFQEWERTGVVSIPLATWHTGEGPAVDVNAVNDAMLAWWRSREFAEVRSDVVAAAEAMDRLAETLSDPVLEQILALRPRTVLRAVHRQEHLAQIESGLGRAT